MELIIVEVIILWIVASTFSVVTMGLGITTRKAHRVAAVVGRLRDNDRRFAEIVMMLGAQRGLLVFATIFSGGVSLGLIITAIRTGLQ